MQMKSTSQPVGLRNSLRLVIIISKMKIGSECVTQSQWPTGRCAAHAYQSPRYLLH